MEEKNQSKFSICVSLKISEKQAINLMMLIKN